MSPVPTALASLRRHRPAGVWLFVFLLFVVAAERRLADAHFNLRTAAPAFEREDSLDGDEIRIRLIILNDDVPPTVPVVTRAIACDVVHATGPCVASFALGHPAPRGPPAPPAAA